MINKTINWLLVILISPIFIFTHNEINAQNRAISTNEINLFFSDSAARYVLENLDRALVEKETIYHRFKGYQMQIEWVNKNFNQSVKNIGDEYFLNRDYNNGIESCKKDSSKVRHILSTLTKLQELEKKTHNQISHHLLSYLPSKEGFDVNLYFVVFTSINGQSTGYNIMSRIDWDKDADAILNGIVHEAYHVGFETQKSNFHAYTKPTPTNRKMFLDKMFMEIQNEGMATWMAYNTQKFIPITRSLDPLHLPEYDYFLLENDSCVKRSFRQINQIIESSEKLPVDSLNKMDWEIGVTERAYYVTGAYMAKTIEEKYGKKHLVDLVFRENKKDFINAYNKLVKDKYKMKMVD